MQMSKLNFHLRLAVSATGQAARGQAGASPAPATNFVPPVGF
jgi:hypothetical protein